MFGLLTEEQIEEKSQEAAQRLAANLMDTLMKSVEARIQEACEQGGDEFERRLAEEVAKLNTRIDRLVRAYSNLATKTQLMLLNEGNELITVPEHLELRKIPKSK